MAKSVGKNGTSPREYSVIIERDAEGYYVAEVPELPGCHTQAKSLDKLMERVREAIQVCRNSQGQSESEPQFIGIQRVLV